jgi:hypothetical protein
MTFRLALGLAVSECFVPVCIIQNLRTFSLEIRRGTTECTVTIYMSRCNSFIIYDIDGCNYL